MFFNNDLHSRLDKIEETQSEVNLTLRDISKQMVRIAPMVEEYHANKIVKKNITEKLRNYSIILGLLLAVGTVGNSLFTKVKSAIASESMSKEINMPELDNSKNSKDPSSASNKTNN